MTSVGILNSGGMSWKQTRRSTALAAATAKQQAAAAEQTAVINDAAAVVAQACAAADDSDDDGRSSESLPPPPSTNNNTSDLQYDGAAARNEEEMLDDDDERRMALMIDAAGEDEDEDETMANEDGDGPPDGASQYINCQNCEKVFWSDSSLKHHQSLYHSEKSFVCEICGKAFRFRSNLAEHRSVHTSLKPYVCKYCGKSSRLKGNLTKHILKHHKKEQNAYIGKDDIIIKKGKKSVKDPAAVDFLERSMLVLTADGQILEPEDRERIGVSSASCLKQMFAGTNGGTRSSGGGVSMVRSSSRTNDTSDLIDGGRVSSPNSMNVGCGDGGSSEEAMLDDVLPVESAASSATHRRDSTDNRSRTSDSPTGAANTVYKTSPQPTPEAASQQHVASHGATVLPTSNTQCHLCGKHFRKGNSLQVHLTLKHGHPPPGSVAPLATGMSSSVASSQSPDAFLGGFTVNGAVLEAVSPQSTTPHSQPTSQQHAVQTNGRSQPTMNPMIGGGTSATNSCLPPPLKIGNRLSTIPVSLPSYFNTTNTAGNNNGLQPTGVIVQQPSSAAQQQSRQQSTINSVVAAASVSPKVSSPTPPPQDQNQALGNELRELKRLVRDLRGNGQLKVEPPTSTLSHHHQQRNNAAAAATSIQASASIATPSSSSAQAAVTATAAPDVTGSSSLETRVSRLEKQVDSALTTIYTLVQLQSTMNTNVNRFREDVIDQLKGIRSMLTNGPQ